MIENSRQCHQECFSKLAYSPSSSLSSHRQTQNDHNQNQQQSNNPYNQPSGSSASSNNKNNSMKKNIFFSGFEYAVQPDGSSLAESLWELSHSQNQQESQSQPQLPSDPRTRPWVNDPAASSSQFKFYQAGFSAPISNSTSVNHRWNQSKLRLSSLPSLFKPKKPLPSCNPNQTQNKTNSMDRYTLPLKKRNRHNGPTNFNSPHCVKKVFDESIAETESRDICKDLFSNKNNNYSNYVDVSSNHKKANRAGNDSTTTNTNTVIVLDNDDDDEVMIVEPPNTHQKPNINTKNHNKYNNTSITNDNDDDEVMIVEPPNAHQKPNIDTKNHNKDNNAPITVIVDRCYDNDNDNDNNDNLDLTLTLDYTPPPQHLEKSTQKPKPSSPNLNGYAFMTANQFNLSQQQQSHSPSLSSSNTNVSSSINDDSFGDEDFFANIDIDQFVAQSQKQTQKQIVSQTQSQFSQDQTQYNNNSNEQQQKQQQQQQQQQQQKDCIPLHQFDQNTSSSSPSWSSVTQLLNPYKKSLYNQSTSITSNTVTNINSKNNSFGTNNSNSATNNTSNNNSYSNDSHRRKRSGTVNHYFTDHKSNYNNHDNITDYCTDSIAAICVNQNYNNSNSSSFTSPTFNNDNGAMMNGTRMNTDGKYNNIPLCQGHNEPCRICMASISTNSGRPSDQCEFFEWVDGKDTNILTETFGGGGSTSNTECPKSKRRKTCDNCIAAREPDRHDFTIEAKQILQLLDDFLIQKNNRGATLKQVIDLYRGSKRKKLLKFLKVDKISYFGAGSKMSKPEVEHLMCAMVSKKILEKISVMSNIDYLRRGPKANALCNGSDHFYVDFPKSSSKTAPSKNDQSPVKKQRGLIGNSGKKSNSKKTYTFSVKNGKLEIAGIETLNDSDNEMNFDSSLSSARKVGSKSKSSNELILPNIHKKELIKRIQRLVSLWADEETMNGNKVCYQNIMRTTTIVTIASQVPLSIEELNDIEGIGENVVKEYGDRLIKNIKTFVKQNNLDKYIATKARKKQKSKEQLNIQSLQDINSSSGGDEFDVGIDFSMIDLP